MESRDWSSDVCSSDLAVHSDGSVAARLRFLHSLWHAAPCHNELFSPVAEASSKSFAHLPRHGPRRRPTSGKPSSRPGEPTMHSTCIRKRSTDGLRCEGTWAYACGRSKDRLGIPGIECDHTFLPWQILPIEKFASDSRRSRPRWSFHNHCRGR